MPQTLTSALAETHHLLVLAPDIDVTEIAILASTRWRGVEREMGEITLSRYSSLFGPYTVGAGLGPSLGLPRGLNQAWMATTLTERGDRPFPGSLDPAGVSRAFPTGLPVREERRVVDFLVAAARRLGGVVRFHGSGVMVAPVPDGALDLTVYSPLWLEPEAALATARSVVPLFDLAINWHSFAPVAPADETSDSFDQWPDSGSGAFPEGLQGQAAHEGGAGSGGLPGDLSATRLAELHAHADQRDQAALAQQPSLDRYALAADLGPAGGLVIEISGVDRPPLALREVDWAAEGAVAYNVRWIPDDPKHLLMEFPPADHCRARSQMATLLASLARIIHHTVGGEVLDADAFPIDPTDL
ncbi:MAG: hypothetical protein LBS27_03510 [Bifidobacteriaceae bacterium]|jgi:hypothetical protein|nr:hypothetical protein [Bifidobacteriaceae bacterium]